MKEIRNNPPPQVNFAYQKNISYSQMSIFRSCAYRWKLQYKDKIKKFNSSIHTVFGTSIHESMQHYLDVAYEKSFAAADREIDIEDYFKSKFLDEYQSQYKSFLPSIDSYCSRVNWVKPIYTHEDKNLYVYSNINAKVVRDITISNEVIEIPPKK